MQPNFDTLAHVEHQGDLHAGPGEYAGSRGKSQFMEGFSLTFKPAIAGMGLRYRAHATGSGDTPWTRDGGFAGSRGAKKSLEGFQIELSGAKLAEYDVLYMTHIRNAGDSAWVANGAYCGTRGQGRPVEGLAVKIVPRTPQYVSLISKASSGSGKALVMTAAAQGNAVRVSATTGHDLQLWDKRPVKGGQGFVLINKARPTLCIARGPAQPVVLKETSQIDTDDSCVWRNDAVPGSYNAINSWTDWELKLNMAGNPPYADQDNVLIAYPWAKGAPNELWRESKATYNLVVGTDDRALNTLSEAIYRGCYPKVFKGALQIQKQGIKSVGYDIVSAPMFSLRPSAKLQELTQQRLAKHFGETPELSQRSAADFAAASIGVHIATLELVVERDKDQIKVPASLQITARIQANPNRTLTLELELGELKIAQMPELELVLDKVFVPLLLEMLNKTVLEHIAIPALDLLGIEFSAPVMATRSPNVLVAASKLPDTASLPPAAHWPEHKIFVGADETVLDSLGAAVLDGVRPKGDWDYGIDIGICDLKLAAHYEMTLRNPQFSVTAKAGNTYKVKIELGGYARFKAKCGFLSASPGAGASGVVMATAALSVNSENKIIMTLKSLDHISLNWSFDGLPSWMDAVISNILGAFNPVVELAVTAALRGEEFELYSIPTIEAAIAGSQFEIRLKDIVLDSGADAAQKPLLLVTGAADVKLKK
jgi:hypothetical protein